MKKTILFLFAVMFAITSMAQTVATEVTLTGSGNDEDGTIVSYSWKQISGPATPTIVSPNAAVTKVIGYTVPGVYVYEITVTDDKGAKSLPGGEALTKVTVLEADNMVPTAKASAEIIIKLPSTKK